MRDDSEVNWTEVGVKVKKLIDARISAEARVLMKPLSIMDPDFDQILADLPSDKARASVMEHTIRAEIHERRDRNPVFYEKLSQHLSRIIEDLREEAIDSAEAFVSNKVRIRSR